MAETERALEELDPGTADRVRGVLPSLLGEVGEVSALNQLAVQRFLWQTLPRLLAGRPREQHEVAWAVGDFLEAAGLPRYAAMARDRRTHEVLAGWWKDPAAGERAAAALIRDSGVEPPDTVLLSFGTARRTAEGRVHAEASRLLEEMILRGSLSPSGDGARDQARRLVEGFLSTPSPSYDGRTPREVVLHERAMTWVRDLDPAVGPFWRRAFALLGQEPAVPTNLELTVGPAQALLQEARNGWTLTEGGCLPAALVVKLDARYGWTEKLPTRSPQDERSVPALFFLDAHVRAQGLLTRSDGKLALTEEGRRCLDDERRLWQVLVSPRPRWGGDFEQDSLAVMAVSLMERGGLSASQLTDQAAAVLSHKWRSATGGGLVAGIEWLRVEWYRVGLALGWWELTRRPERYRLSEFGRAAAAELFWAVAGRPSN